MAKLEVMVTAAFNGARLDKAIVALVGGASRARVKRAIEEGAVRVNGVLVAKGGVVKDGDRIEIDENTIGSGDEPCVPEPDAPPALAPPETKAPPAPPPPVALVVPPAPVIPPVAVTPPLLVLPAAPVAPPPPEL